MAEIRVVIGKLDPSCLAHAKMKNGDVMNKVT